MVVCVQMKIADLGMARHVLPPPPASSLPGRHLLGAQAGSPLASRGGSVVSTPKAPAARTFTPGIVGTITYSAPEVLGVLEEEPHQQQQPGVDTVLKVGYSLCHSYSSNLAQLLPGCALPQVVSLKRCVLVLFAAQRLRGLGQAQSCMTPGLLVTHAASRSFAVCRRTCSRTAWHCGSVWSASGPGRALTACSCGPCGWLTQQASHCRHSLWTQQQVSEV